MINIDEFKKKKFIMNMINYYDTVKNKNKTKNNYIVLKEVYNICISAINIFRPLLAMEIYAKYNPKSILDFTCGWGGRLIGACALNIPNYIGIDINTNLTNSYLEMKDFLKTYSETNIEIYIENAVTFDYSKINYDMVLTSPPYYFLEKYSNNETYNNSKNEMKNKFYIPVITNTYKHLQQGGKFCLNVNKEIYEDVCVSLLGIANDIIPFKKSKRQNNYEEYIYVWYKL
jgi:tRNA1(Val) A37 N6-methylase TrmN6